MHFPGFPFNKELPSFVSHTDMLEYLQQYATHYDLYKNIQFHTLVEKVEPVQFEAAANPRGDSGVLGDNVTWKVTSRNVKTGDRQETKYDAVLVCNG